MSTERKFNLVVIRELVQGAFDLEGLNDFCFDFFRSVYEGFEEGDQKKARVQKLIEYAERKGQLDELLAHIQKEKPHKYEEFANQLFEVKNSPSLSSNEPVLRIDPQANIKNLPENEMRLIARYYGSDYQSIQVRKSLSGSLQGRRVYLVNLWHRQLGELAPQVIKIAPYQELKEEYQRYQNYVGDFVTLFTAQIKKNPIQHDEFGAMAYTSISDDVIGKALSFDEYYEQYSIQQIKEILDNLLPRLGERWYSKGQIAPDYASPQAYFDHFYGAYFPADLTLTLRSNTDDSINYTPPMTTSSDYYIPQENDIEIYRSLEVGQRVQINGLRVHRQRPKQLELIALHWALPLRVKLIGADPLPLPEKNQQVWIRGEISARRPQELSEKVVGAFSGLENVTLDPQAEMITIAGHSYPNPLVHYQTYLNRRLTDNFSIVHGDLHAFNIIIDSSHRPWLIDFGEVGVSHKVFDFIMLERFLRRILHQHTDQNRFALTDLIDFETRLISASLTDSNTVTPPTNHRLAKAFEVINHIRYHASDYMVGRNDSKFSSEYLPALFLHALASLKYYGISKDFLDIQHNFITAAIILAYLEGQSLNLPTTTRLPIPNRSPSQRAINPFIYGSPITNPTRFIGRQKEIIQIQDRLLNAEFESTSIVGERRSGKTSLLKYLSHPKVTQSNGFPSDEYIFLFIDFQIFGSSQTPTDFWQLILQEIRDRVDSTVIRSHIDKIYAEELINPFILNPLFSAIDTINLHIVLLLDEFEKITQNKNFNVDFFSGLRSLAIHHNLALVTSSRRELIELTHSKVIEASPFFNIFTTVNLPLFSEAEGRDLIGSYLADNDTSFRKDDIDKILEIGGLHPYFLQMACHILYHIYQRERDPQSRHLTLYAEFYQKASAMFSSIWDYSSADQKVLLIILSLRELERGDGEGNTSLPLISFHGNAEYMLQVLEKRGLVKVESEMTGSHRIFSLVFRDWIADNLIVQPGDSSLLTEWAAQHTEQLSKLADEIRLQILQILPRLNHTLINIIGDWLLTPSITELGVPLLEHFLFTHKSQRLNRLKD